MAAVRIQMFDVKFSISYQMLFTFRASSSVIFLLSAKLKHNNSKTSFQDYSEEFFHFDKNK